MPSKQNYILPGQKEKQALDIYTAEEKQWLLKLQTDYSPGTKILDAEGKVAIVIDRVTDGTLKTTCKGYIYGFKNKDGSYRLDKDTGDIIAKQTRHPLRHNDYETGAVKLLDRLPDEKNKRVWLWVYPIWKDQEHQKGILYKHLGKTPLYPDYEHKNPVSWKEFFTEILPKFQEHVAEQKIEIGADEHDEGAAIGEAIAEKVVTEMKKTEAEIAGGLTEAMIEWLKEHWSRHGNDTNLAKIFNQQFKTQITKKGVRAYRNQLGLSR